MPSNNKTFAIVLFLGICGFLGAAHLGAQASINWLLYKDSSAAGMDWAHLIADRIPEISQSHNEADGAHTNAVAVDKELVDFENLISSIFSVGNIYQVDFIDVDCGCVASYGSYEPSAKPSQSAAHGDEHSHSAVNNSDGHPTVTLARRKLVSVLDNTSDHNVHSHEGSQDMQLPLDQNIFHDLKLSDDHMVHVHYGLTGNQPSTVGETYHPIFQDGASQVIVRTLVDLDQAEANYTWVHYKGVAGILLLMVLIVSYPLSKYFKEQAQRRRAHERLNIIANQDALTHLANRNAFQDHAPGLLLRANEEGKRVSLYLFDVDNFKEINDYHGHEIGDQVLKEIANQLRKIAPQDCMVARLGGDEFAVLIREEAQTANDKPDLLQFPIFHEIEISGTHQKISVSVCSGVSHFPDDSEDLTELMRHADLALYSAKNTNKAASCEYAPKMGLAFRTRLDLFSDFRVALRDSEIVPYYQPLLSTVTGQVKGLEALARWRQPDGSIVNANAFKDVLSDRKICEMVGLEMLQRVTRDMGQWKRELMPFESIAINIDVADLMRPGFEMDVVSNIAKNGLLRGELSIEVTEEFVFDSNKDLLLERLNRLRDAGCQIVLDDFGTGYSSVTHLRELPLSAIKIDKSFTQNLIGNKFDQAIVKSLVSLGREFQFKVIAEGVELLEQSQLLHSLGCNLVQGHLYSKAVCAADVPALLSKLNSEATRPVLKKTA